MQIGELAVASRFEKRRACVIVDKGHDYTLMAFLTHNDPRLESLEGKRLAIDSSIWLYHFQMAMRDKEGRTLSNAHILGFLWRILKLIHFGIRPIFVFDGGAPVLKRKTLSGRKTRKQGARDDHRRVAERLLHARMREAAVTHVTDKSVEGQDDAQGMAEGGLGSAMTHGHGLGDSTVYMDDLAGTTGASAAVQGATDAIDDGAISIEAAREREKETEAARKKKRDQWHKDPYALPALERDMSRVTAENSSAARKGRGGGKRPDVRFATEGELRSLLSSIKPTDLDLDSDFFRSLPAELQYELVGDLRAASRGTSYKRLQSMLAQSPTPIDFSRAQIAGLKTRNGLTQKVLEVTDEIGDAHIKVPIRVAGARNREYVLVRNKGDQAGFVLGVREAGNTEEKAINIDEDTASATTVDDDVERRNTEDEIDLEEVDVQQSPVKDPSMNTLPANMQSANPNDPLARKQVARELLQRRARQLAKEKARVEGFVDENEIMEEQLQMICESSRGSSRQSNRNSGTGAPDGLFRSIAESSANPVEIERLGQGNLSDDSEDDIQIHEQSPSFDDQVSQDEANDLAQALHVSEQTHIVQSHPQVDYEDGDADDEIEMDEVDTHAFGAEDYEALYGTHTVNLQSALPVASNNLGAQPGGAGESYAKSQEDESNEYPTSAVKLTEKRQKFAKGDLENIEAPSRTLKSSAGLGFRMLDREGYPERLNPNLLQKKIRWEEDEQDEDKAGDVPNAGTADDNVGNPAAKDVSISGSESEGDEAPHVKREAASPAKRERNTNVPSQVKDSDEFDNTVKAIDFGENKIDEKPGARPRYESSSPITTSGMRMESHAEGLQAPENLDNNYSLAEAKDPTIGIAEAPTRVDLKIAPPSDTRDSHQGSTSRSPVGNHQISSPDINAERDEPRSSIAEPLPPEAIEDGSELGRHDHTPAPTSDTILPLDKERQPEFDNMSSMIDEEGAFPRIQTMEDSNRDQVEDDTMYSPPWDSPTSGLDSRSSSPEQGVALGPDGFPLPSAEELDAMEAEDEADLGRLEGDQDEFVSFLSRAKGRGLREVRQEVEDEVAQLRTEHAATRRTEGDITQQMAKEIQLMLRLFGLPYITAPMEAEAQCAELVAIGLADGIITDDSDVFLFGGTFVYKNMFNNKKYVECFKLSDLQHDLGMDRTKLVQLAYLLGSDYTDGLEGVGPVLAMEILGNFEGEDALIRFREWWMKVQTGQDTPRDTCNTTLKRVKRTLRSKIHFDTHWPDGNVLNAYYEPTVDSSDEPFQWGLPDLDSLRSFFAEYLRWDREKTDHYLLPAIEEQNRRHRRTQATLDTGNFFGAKGGQGAAAGRVRPGYNSSRLQQVIKNFRAAKAGPAQASSRGGKGQEPVTLSEDEDVDVDDAEEAEGAVPEQLIGKEMGKRSRPVVSRAQHSQAPGRVEEADEGSEGERGPDEGAQPNKRKRSTTSVRGRGGARRGRGRGRGGASKQTAAHSGGANHGSGRQAQDVEWQPRAPRPRRSAHRSDSGTSLTQGRNMNLDSVDSLLPPSRAGLRRDRSTSSSLLNTPTPGPGSEQQQQQHEGPSGHDNDESRTPISLSDNSSLSDEEPA